MSGLVLRAEDRAYLLRKMRQQTNSHLHRRMNVLLLLDDGWAAERVAEALYIDVETGRQHRRRYETSGVAGLELLAYEGSEPLLSAAQQEALKAELEARLYMAAKAVCDFVRRTFGIGYTPNARTNPRVKPEDKALKRLGFVYKKPKCVPAKADAAAKEVFAREALLPLIAQAGPARPLYFVDGMHPAYTGHQACGWIRRGMQHAMPERDTDERFRARVALVGVQAEPHAILNLVVWVCQTRRPSHTQRPAALRDLANVRC